MGMKEPGLADTLFSKTQQRVLGLLFGNPDRSYYANEIMRFAGAGIGTVQRELERLTAVGLLVASKVGNQKHYQVNRESPIFEELRSIVLKTFGVADVLRGALDPLKQRLRAAFIYGSIAKGTDTARSDVDLMLIGTKLSYTDVIPFLVEAEKRIGRKVKPSIYSAGEFRRKLEQENSFLLNVIRQPKVFLIGSEDDIKKSR